MFVRSGVRLFKYWFSVTREEQRRRFMSRETDPLKQWKLSPIDKASLDKWDDYTEAKEAMFFNTDTADAPWTIIKSDDKKRARLNCMLHFLSSLPYDNKDHRVVVGPDPLIVGSSSLVIGGHEPYPRDLDASGQAAQGLAAPPTTRPLPSEHGRGENEGRTLSPGLARRPPAPHAIPAVGGSAQGRTLDTRRLPQKA